MVPLKIHLAVILSILMVLISCSPSETQINFCSPQSVYLYTHHLSDTISDLELVNIRENLLWKGNASLIWEVDVPEKDDYEVYLIAHVREAGDGTKITIEAGEQLSDFTISKTSGPIPGGENFSVFRSDSVMEGLNFERAKLSGSIALEAGKQTITVSTSGIEKEDVLLHFRAFELLPVSKKELIAAEEARAKSARASFDWMAETGYGLMFHWTSGTRQQDGSRLSYEDAVNDFDVIRFADMIDETGAGYVIFPIGHAQSYCPAPLESWERIHPGMTTQRDLLEEMANALNERGIRLICYINGPLGFKYPRWGGSTPEQNEAFIANYTDILTELGMRYKDKIAGYWYDTFHEMFKEYPQLPFEDFFNASKTGNKDRLICLNPWIWPEVSPWQDFWSGEVQYPIALPENGFMKNGPSPHLPYQALLTMEKHSWGVGRNGEIKDPQFTSEELGSYIKACMDNGGAVTINMSIYQDGTVGEKALKVMQGVKESIR